MLLVKKPQANQHICVKDTFINQLFQRLVFDCFDDQLDALAVTFGSGGLDNGGDSFGCDWQFGRVDEEDGGEFLHCLILVVLFEIIENSGRQ